MVDLGWSCEAEIVNNCLVEVFGESSDLLTVRRIESRSCFDENFGDCTQNLETFLDSFLREQTQRLLFYIYLRLFERLFTTLETVGKSEELKNFVLGLQRLTYSKIGVLLGNYCGLL